MNTSQATEIVRRIADDTGVPFDAIVGDTRRNPAVNQARWQAYAAIWDACRNYSLTARLMQRDHSTVMHGIRKMRGAA